MTGLRARLGKMTPALTARQRFLAIFNAHRAGTTVDPELRASMPPEQAGEFYAYTRLLFASEVLLGNAAVTVHGHVGELDRLVERIVILEHNTAELERTHPELTRKPGERRRKGGRVTIPEWLRELAAQLRSTLVDEIRYRWHELRCIELLWDDMATQWDGVDPAHPTVRAKVEEAREGLRRMAATVPQGVVLLTEPPEEKVASLRTYVREAYELLGWAEGGPLAQGRKR